MAFSDVIRFNLRRLREERGWSQRRIAEAITSRTGEVWTSFRLSDLEGGRRGRDRTISPEELLTLALTYDVSIVELMTPPESVETDSGSRPVRVQVGQDQVSPELFHRLAFLLGPEWRTFGERAHHGRDQEGQFASSSAVMWYVREILNPAAAAVMPDGVDVWDWISDEDNLMKVLERIRDDHGVEALWKLNSERMREVLGTSERRDQT